jgi:hypothetical protein
MLAGIFVFLLPAVRKLVIVKRGESIRDVIALVSVAVAGVLFLMAL